MLWVRGIIDKLKPGQVEEARKGTVVGTIDGLNGTSADTAEKAFRISVIGHADLPVLFADGGQFVINGVPEGVWAIEVIKQGQANEERQIHCRRLTIEAEKATPILIKFDAS